MQATRVTIQNILKIVFVGLCCAVTSLAFAEDRYQTQDEWCDPRFCCPPETPTTKAQLTQIHL